MRNFVPDREPKTLLLTRSDHVGVDAQLELSAHVLRHTCLTNLVRAGNDLALIAEIAGHKRLETTRRYSLPPWKIAKQRWKGYRESTEVSYA
jgi:site-specific recombinase XerD